MRMRTATTRPIGTTFLLIAAIAISLSRPAAASDPPSDAALAAEVAGDVVHILIPAVAFGATFWKHDAPGRNQFYKSFATNIATTMILKYSVERIRPNGFNRSYPSGHTSMAFQGAAFLHRRYGWEYGLPAYLGATFVGYTRIVSDNHHVEDVVVGAVVGMASSFVFTRPYKGVTITPYAVPNNCGISIRKTW